MTEDERFESILATRSIVEWPQSIFIKYQENSGLPYDINQWLEKYIGKRGYDWSLEYKSQGQLYKFKNPDHKTLFALTWL